MTTTEEYGDLETRLETVEGALADLIDAVSERPAGGPWLWTRLDKDRQVALWEELAEFVAWLTARYLSNLQVREYRLPPCWYRHPVVVEQLTALMVAHQGAYNEAAAEPSPALVDWHERSLWPTLDRLRHLKVFSGCDDGHQDHQWTAPPWQADETFHEFVAQSLPAEPEEEQ